MTVTTKTRKTLTKKVATKVKKVNSRVKTLASCLVNKTKKTNCKIQKDSQTYSQREIHREEGMNGKG